MEVELDNFEDGRPVLLETNVETAGKIKAYKGKKQYKQLLELALAMPSTKERYLIQANALLHLKKWKELDEACDKGLDFASQQQASDFFNLKGKAVGKMGNFQEKVKFTLKAIDINPKVAAYHRNLGAAYYKLKQYEKAIEGHNTAISIEPKHSINYHNKGAAFFRMGQFEDAQHSFEKAVALDKKQTISYSWLADSFKEMGNYDEAYKNYNKAYSISDSEDYKKSAKAMEEKMNPGKKKGFFSKLFS